LLRHQLLELYANEGLQLTDDYFLSVSYIVAGGISQYGGVVSKFLLIMLIYSLSLASSGEEKAVERLSLTTDMLVSIGEEMAGQPVSGMLIVGDTVTVDLQVSAANSYQFIIWTDSAFNYVDFWLTNPLGETPRGDISDHTTLAIMPDSIETGTWHLQMELLEGAYSDTAYYAAATFARSRLSQ